MTFVLAYVALLSQVLIYAIVAWSLLSWFPIRWNNRALVILRYIVDPLLIPLRRLRLRIGMIDLTPVVAIVILIVIPYILSFALS